MAEKRFENEIEEVLYHIENGNNFLLSGGAGSGKTYSLVQTLKRLSAIYPTAHITCITYTNAAAIEIKNRAEIKNLRVSTIHDFLWDTIVPFQKEMKRGKMFFYINIWQIIKLLQNYAKLSIFILKLSTIYDKINES